MRRRAGGDDVWWSRSDNAISPGTAFGPEVDLPVGVANHIQMVLDRNHCVAFADQAIDVFQQQLDIGRVQSGRGLIEQVQRASGGGTSRPASPR